MSGRTKKPNPEIAVSYNVAKRATRKKWTKERKEEFQTWMKERKETFLKQFREKYPDIDIKITPEIIDSGKKVWLKRSRTASDNVAEFEKSLALDLILQPFTEDFIKEVNRAKSDPTAEKTSKVVRAQLKKKRISTWAWEINDEARGRFLVAFKEKISEKYPDIDLKDNSKVLKAERKAWSCMTDIARAPYIAQVEDKWAYQMYRSLCHPGL